jgi:CheY-like chemotaxis protein
MGRGGFFAVDSLRGIYILVLEREPAWRGLLRGVLEYCGALVTAVESAKEALRLMEQISPNALIVRLSDTDARELAREVRAHRQPGERPVSIVAIGSGQDAAAMSAGAFDGCVPEPLDPWALCRLLSDLTQTR